MARFNWVCPSCRNHSTIGGDDFESGTVSFCTRTGLQKNDGISLNAKLVRCPNESCQESEFRVTAVYGKPSQSAYGITVQPDPDRRVGVGTFQFLPTTVNPLSVHVPAQVLEDYSEAYLIRELSPKASATLARRALQGMIRDFWGIAKGTLAAELHAIKDKCDHALWEAMMAMKGVGNIGAHPERDVSLIVEIEPGEAQQLLDLIHLLDSEWYVARADRAARLAKVTALGKEKAEARSPGDA